MMGVDQIVFFISLVNKKTFSHEQRRSMNPSMTEEGRLQ